MAFQQPYATFGLFLVVGKTEKKIQIVKFGNTETLTPSQSDLDLVLLKELGIKSESEE